MEEVTKRASALTPFAAKCCGGKPPEVFFQLDTGERKTIAPNTGIRQGEALGSAFFCMPEGTILRKFRTRFEPNGTEVEMYMDDTAISWIDINPETVQAATLWKKELQRVGVQLNEAKPVALPPMGHTSTEQEVALRAGVRIGITEEGGVVVGIAFGTDALVQVYATKVVKEKRAEPLGRLLAMLVAAMLVATKSMA